MKYALVFTRHDSAPTGPMARSLFQYAETNNVPLRFASRDNDWDEFDVLIWFHNRPPNIDTTAKVCWWMCDARTVKLLSSTAYGKGKADYIFLCHTYYLKEYSEYYKGKTYYLPQCGDDTPEVSGRKIDTDCVFIGSIPRLANKSLDVSNELRLWKPEDEAEGYEWAFRYIHLNRLPLMQTLQKLGISVSVIQGEKTTVDQKFIYRTTPISLAISPQIPGYTSNRLYNILASSGFCLTLKFPGIENLFENHKHLVWYESPEEAIELINYYKSHEGERKKIAEQGHLEYLANHTAAARVQYMLKTALNNCSISMTQEGKLFL